MSRKELVDTQCIPDGFRNINLIGGEWIREVGLCGLSKDVTRYLHQRDDDCTTTTADYGPGGAMSVLQALEPGSLPSISYSGELFAVSQGLSVDAIDQRGYRQRIGEIARQTALSRGVSLRLIPWQIEAAARFLEGKDQLVISRTGDGKTFCFLLAALAALDRTIMVITPLLTLMDCHVSTASRYGLKAVSLNASSLQDDPGIVTRAIAGHYQLIFVCPEMLKTNVPIFQKLSKSKAYCNRLLGFVVDEVHLCHQWKTFRADYSDIGLLRVFFPRVPFMGLSATMPVHIRSFIHTTLRLPKHCPMIQRSVNRENLCFFALPIRSSTREYNDLKFLLPSSSFGNDFPTNIPKTMVFVDGLKQACTIATELGKLIPNQMYDEHCEVVLEFLTGITLERRNYNLERFIEGSCRILVCTEACGMGLDVPDIERVIQWRLSPRCNLTTLYQRFGRAARSTHTQGVGILFYTRYAEVTETHEKEAQIYTKPWDDPQYERVVQDIVRFDMGLASLTAPQSLKRKADSLGELPTTRSNYQSGIQSPAHENTDISNPNDAGNPKRAPLRLPLVCRGILSFINTTKCRRQIILKYFNDSSPQPDTLPCCDRCLLHDMPPEIHRLVSVQRATNYQASVKSKVRIKKLPIETVKKIEAEINTLRNEQWKQTGGNYRFVPYTASCLLNYKEAHMIAIKATSIKKPENVHNCITKKQNKWDGKSREQLFSHIFDQIKSILEDPPLPNPIIQARPVLAEISNNPVNTINPTNLENQPQHETTASQAAKKRKVRSDKGSKRGPRAPKTAVAP